MKYKILWVTLCRNEEVIIPFCIDYWKKVADKVVVYDNHSTDSSVELLSKYDWIEIRHFDSDGQNDVIQKTIKEKAFMEFRDQASVIIISDMDELFHLKDVDALVGQMIDGGYDVLEVPIHSLCEDSKPEYEEGKLLHQLCHKFYKQKMNHMIGLDKWSKISIFNCNTVDKVLMSVGQHYVRTYPEMKVLFSIDGFCLHIDKGFGEDFYVSKRKKMAANLSEVNKMGGMCIEYSKPEEESRKEYREHQMRSYDLNKLVTF